MKKYKHINVTLSKKNIKRLLKGYAVQKRIINKEVGDIRLSISNDSNDRKIQRKILRLKQEIATLKNERSFRIKRQSQTKKQKEKK